TARICRAASTAFRPYSTAVMWPICQVPSISLPRQNCLTPHGDSTPCCRRRLLHLVPDATLQYSTSGAACSGVPVPRLRPNSGSVPTARHHARNSLVPNWFVSIEYPSLSTTDERADRGPTP